MIKTKIKKIICGVIIAIGLLCGGVFLSVISLFNSDINPNIHSYNHEAGVIKNTNGIISGKFTANDDYLSLITVKFDNPITPNGNSLFRIKNILDNDWYQVATISASNYFVVPQYTFGFPTIDKSKNKIYYFEIKMIDESNQLTLSRKYPVLISQYQYPKNALFENKQLFIEFLIKKLTYYINGDIAWKVVAVYTFPFFLYLIYSVRFIRLVFKTHIHLFKTKLYQLLSPYMFIIFLGIFIDIFIIRKYLDTTTILFTILWILGVTSYRLNAYFSFVIAFILLMFSPIVQFAHLDWIGTKSAVWAYMFFIVGTFHIVIELKSDQSPRTKQLFCYISRFFSFITYIDSILISCILNTKNYAFSSTKNFIKTLLQFVIVTLLLITVFHLYLNILSYRNRQMKNPGTPKIEPTLVYPGTKVFLYGERFGDGKNDKYAVMRNGERVQVDYWEDHKIIFTVPLSWKPGEMNLWIEKPVEWNAQIIIERTKPKSIKLLKVTGHFTPDDDLYFKEKKSWKKETLELNGYNSTK